MTIGPPHTAPHAPRLFRLHLVRLEMAYTMQNIPVDERREISSERSSLSSSRSPDKDPLHNRECS